MIVQSDYIIKPNNLIVQLSLYKLYVQIIPSSGIIVENSDGMILDGEDIVLDLLF